jgi:hypothetical protein
MPLPGLANAKTLEDIFLWNFYVVYACLVFALDDYSFIFHRTFSNLSAKSFQPILIIFFTNLFNPRLIKKPRFIGGAAYSFWLKKSIR